MTAKSRSKTASLLALRATAATLAATCMLALLAHGSARAADAPAADTSDQVIVPGVERRDVHKPKYPSNDFEIGLFGGSYSSQNFGTSFNWGARLGYDITEDFFVEATYGLSKVSDKEFRQILPGGIFTAEQEKLKYYDLSLGYNFLPGEVFIGRNLAMTSALYMIGGIGNVTFAGDHNFAVNFGAGFRVLPTDWLALHIDVQDLVFKSNDIGFYQLKNNLQATIGASVFF